MKDIFRSVAMAFSMFSSIPTPRVEWKDSNMKYMLCALPLVGGVIGAVMVLWYVLCDALNVGRILYAAGMVLIPLLVSGGIHLDGFCDTVDALASHAPA
ncbi:MAG: adenosylcobinamide-GDP ribazoletransferase, partial [Clostridia bacterium]|nr:adenosylcobinamide-GDP ribazoletransferase [Clostridia bacterium]